MPLYVKNKNRLILKAYLEVCFYFTLYTKDNQNDIAKSKDINPLCIAEYRRPKFFLKCDCIKKPFC